MLSTNDEDIGAVSSWLQGWELTLGLHATWPAALLQEYLKGVAKVCASFVREGKEREEIEDTSCCDVVVGLGLVAMPSRIRIFNNACLASRIRKKSTRTKRALLEESAWIRSSVHTRRFYLRLSGIFSFNIKNHAINNSTHYWRKWQFYAKANVSCALYSINFGESYTIYYILTCWLSKFRKLNWQ